jgi:hypothetical protein
MSILAASVTACPDPSGKQVVLYGQTLFKESKPMLFMSSKECLSEIFSVSKSLFAKVPKSPTTISLLPGRYRESSYPYFLADEMISCLYMFMVL